MKTPIRNCEAKIKAEIKVKIHPRDMIYNLYLYSAFLVLMTIQSALHVKFFAIQPQTGSSYALSL